MEPWRQQLELGFAALNKKTLRVVETFSEKVKAADSEEDCEHCLLKCSQSDMLKLPCSHHLCNDCVRDLLERAVGYVERTYSLSVDGILICSKCHEVCAVNRKTVFTGSLHSRDRGTLARTVFEIHQKNTETLRSNCEVKHHYENQRRTPLGRFSKDSLLAIERRPYTSVTDNAPLVLEAIDEKVNAAQCIWLEDWTFDKSSGPQGWQYAWNWPKPQQPDGWVSEPSASTFVRRRKMLRVCVALRAVHALQGNSSSGAFASAAASPRKAE